MFDSQMGGGGKRDVVCTRADLHFFIKKDAEANGMHSCYLKYVLGLLYGLERAHTFRYLKALRHLEYHTNNDGLYHHIAKLYYKVKLSRLGMRYQLRVRPNSCGYGLKILHIFGGGHIINAERVGNYCSFNAGSVVGNYGPDNMPTLGDHVGMGPGAKIFGKVSVGDNSFIAANAVVTKNMPANSIVGGVPARIIKMKEE